MKYERPKIETESDFRRFLGRVFVALYLFAVFGLVVTWQIEGGPLWPTVATAIVTAPLMVISYLVSMPSALQVFRRQREAGRYKLERLKIE